MDPRSALLLILAWLAYGALHSLLASHGCKAWVARRWPGLMPYYRLSFNLLALLLLLPLGWLLHRWRGEPLWQWHGLASWLAHGLAFGALLLFVWSLRYYDSREFLGLRQLAERRRDIGDGEALCLSPLHRFVRHPWYSLGLVLIWTQPMDWALLISALCISGYFILGSRLEERKLLVLHGAVYADYRRLVPALLPLPWRRLSPEQARELEGRAQGPHAPGDGAARP